MTFCLFPRIKQPLPNELTLKEKNLFQQEKKIILIRVYPLSTFKKKEKTHWKSCFPLTLIAQNKNCSRRHFDFLLLSFEENNA